MDGILPEGYRFRLEWLPGPTEVAGRIRKKEYVRIIEREVPDNTDYPGNGYTIWVSVGFWEECLNSLMAVKLPAFEEL